MLKLFKNGIVIQEKISYIDGYKGIEGFNWPLNFKDGYDYAYQGGSYYSCVNNDIVSKRINEFKNIELNEFGLFDNEKN